MFVCESNSSYYPVKSYNYGTRLRIFAKLFFFSNNWFFRLFFCKNTSCLNGKYFMMWKCSVVSTICVLSHYKWLLNTFIMKIARNIAEMMILRFIGDCEGILCVLIDSLRKWLFFEMKKRKYRNFYALTCTLKNLLPQYGVLIVM